jgi:glycosyltransferase involved in cell wall biosynthesis
MNTTKIIVINTSSYAANHLASGLAVSGLLSKYVRPYANLRRSWENYLQTTSIPIINKLYKRTFGRRILPNDLSVKNVHEVAILLDFICVLVGRIQSKYDFIHQFQRQLINARTLSLAKYGEQIYNNEHVVASYGCAELAFRAAKKRGNCCILNYPIAHHQFKQKLLLQEQKLEPTFSDSLNLALHNSLPSILKNRLDTEIEMADHILVGSSFVRDSFLSEGVAAEKLEVIPYGADLSLFSKKDESDLHKDQKEFKVLFVGQITQRKGISYLLRAYQKFKTSKTSLILVGNIVGKSEGLLPYRKLFQHIGHVSQSELKNIYQQSDVFVFPSLIEGMPLVVLEAMACGLPVIVTPNGPGDIVRDGLDGYVVPMRDVDAIIDRLNILKNNPELRLTMGMNARKRSVQFSWDAYKQKAVQKIIDWTN